MLKIIHLFSVFLYSNLLLHKTVVIINGNKSLKAKLQSTPVRSWWNTTVLKRISRFYVRKSLASCCYEIALSFINQIYSINISTSTSSSVILSLYFILVINLKPFIILYYHCNILLFTYTLLNFINENGIYTFSHSHIHV